MEKDSKAEAIIESFIQEVKKKVPAITKIIYEYNSSTGDYFIWHNLIPSEEEKHRKELGILICDYLLENNIYDVSFAYSLDKFNELEE